MDTALYVNNVENRLKCDRRGIRTPWTGKNKHLFLEWDEKAHYTTTELGRLHRYFAHPPVERLAAILRRAGDPTVEQGTRALLTELTKHCDICQRLARQPGRFRVTLPPDDVVFNRTVLLDVMYLDRRPLLHIIDKVTLFSAACFLNGETVEAVWQAYLDSWVCRYIGHAEAIHIHAAPQFRSAAWQALAQSAGTRLINAGVESHNALKSGKRYHEYLRNIHRRIRSEHGGLSQESALILACHAMNSTAGTDGLIPTLLVFGVIPRMPVAPLRLPFQRDRVQAMVTARPEMLANIAPTRLRTALATPVPSAADRDVHPGMKMLVYREPPANDWVGPYTVISQADKMVSLAVDGQAKLSSIDKVKEYLPAAPSQPGANIISGRFLYTLKQVGTPDELPKTRFVAQGHRDKAKDFVVHNHAVLRQRSTRMLVSTSAILNFRLYLHGITQAYLQSQEDFTRDLYLRPRAEDCHLFDLAEDEVLLLVLPLYGICDAGDYWHVTLTSHIEEDLGMVPLVSRGGLRRRGFCHTR
eukprot:contig_7710_g1812